MSRAVPGELDLPLHVVLHLVPADHSVTVSQLGLSHSRLVADFRTSRPGCPIDAKYWFIKQADNDMIKLSDLTSH